jgi:hypothetical protein
MAAHATAALYIFSAGWSKRLSNHMINHTINHAVSHAISYTSINGGYILGSTLPSFHFSLLFFGTKPPILQHISRGQISS